MVFPIVGFLLSFISVIIRPFKKRDKSGKSAEKLFYKRVGNLGQIWVLNPHDAPMTYFVTHQGKYHWRVCGPDHPDSRQTAEDVQDLQRGEACLDDT